MILFIIPILFIEFRIRISFITFPPVSLVHESIIMPGASIDQASLVIEARQIRDIVTKLEGLKLDHTEYTCLKALALFKPGKNIRLYRVYFISLFSC